MLKFSGNFLIFQRKLSEITILKKFEWFEWFEWFGPSPIEPFNSGADRVAAASPARLSLRPLRLEKADSFLL